MSDAHEPPLTLVQLTRALAAHALLVAHPDRLHDLLAPEMGEETAAFILNFARGEPVARPGP